MLIRYNSSLVAEIIAIKEGDYKTGLDIFETLMRIAQEEADHYAEGYIHSMPSGQPQMPMAYFNMVKDLRSIGTERSYLTRFYIVARTTGLFDENDVTNSLFVLLAQLIEKIELIMGAEASEELLNLLSMYTIRLEGLIDAILSDDQASIAI